LPAVSATAQPLAAARPERSAAIARWWPLAALTLLGAVLRLSTLHEQSFWYDEAFTVVRDLHPSLSSTLHSVVHTENNPPLWYLFAWADSRLFGTGEVALRLPSALFGIALIPVAWGIGSELSGRRVATLLAALVAVNPLYVWYGQEARPYGLFLFTAGLAMLCFLRADSQPSRGRMVAFVIAGALALLSHYFAVFLLAGMVLWVLREPGRRRRAALAATGALVLAGLALLPLVIAQGGHGTQWIGRWALSGRLQAIPQYYLTGYSGASLGRGVELLVALPILLGVALAIMAARRPRANSAAIPTPAAGAAPPGRSERDGLALLALLICTGMVVPLALALLGADYLAPRNLLGAMIPVSAGIALIVGSPRTGRAGILAGAAIAAASLAITLDVDLSPRLQRGNWRGLAHALGPGTSARAVTTVQLGLTPLEYYLPRLRSLHTGSRVLVDEIDETGYAPLRRGAGRSPVPGFVLRSRRDIDGLIVMRFVSPVPRYVSQLTLRRHVITNARPEVLVARDARLST
jgi:4-amino-4-deoxy-L-arabinose transferase-like glycosyltransferase